MNNQSIHLLLSDPQSDTATSLLAGWDKPSHVGRHGMSLRYEPQDRDYVSCPGKRVMDRLVAEFAGLHASKECGKAILDFARRWGVLGLCKHDRPVRHRCYALPFGKPCKTVKRSGSCYEPLAGWMIYSQLVGALLEAGALVRGMKEAPLSITLRREGQRIIPFSPPSAFAEESVSLEALRLPGNIELWKIINRFILRSGPPILSPSEFTTNAQAAKIILMCAMVTLLREPGVYLNFWWWNTKKPSFFLSGETNEYGHGGLFGALAIYTMLSLSVATRLVKCRECPSLFQLPDARRQNALLCQTCSQRLAHRDAAKRYTELERQNPDREKRRRLTSGQREAVRSAMGKGKPGTARRLAKKYGVSVRAIYKIGSALEQQSKKGEGS